MGESKSQLFRISSRARVWGRGAALRKESNGEMIKVEAQGKIYRVLFTLGRGEFLGAEFRGPWQVRAQHKRRLVAT